MGGSERSKREEILSCVKDYVLHSTQAISFTPEHNNPVRKNYSSPFSSVKTEFHKRLINVPTVQSQNIKSGFKPWSRNPTQIVLLLLHCRLSFISSTSPPSIGCTRTQAGEIKDMKTMACFKNKHHIRHPLAVK